MGKGFLPLIITLGETRPLPLTGCLPLLLVLSCKSEKIEENKSEKKEYKGEKVASRRAPCLE
jgi:hypothetical protein